MKIYQIDDQTIIKKGLRVRKENSRFSSYNVGEYFNGDCGCTINIAESFQAMNPGEVIERGNFIVTPKKRTALIIPETLETVSMAMVFIDVEKIQFDPKMEPCPHRKQRTSGLDGECFMCHSNMINLSVLSPSQQASLKMLNPNDKYKYFHPDKGELRSYTLFLSVFYDQHGVKMIGVDIVSLEVDAKFYYNGNIYTWDGNELTSAPHLYKIIKI